MYLKNKKQTLKEKWYEVTSFAERQNQINSSDRQDSLELKKNALLSSVFV